jgi:hypothetical protein
MTSATSFASRSRSVKAWSRTRAPIGRGCRNYALCPLLHPCRWECRARRIAGRHAQVLAKLDDRWLPYRGSDRDGRHRHRDMEPRRRWGHSPHTKTARRERVFDAEPQGEWVARSRKNAVRLVRNGPPSGAADESMDRVMALRPLERQLMAAPVELVAAILQSVVPRDQRLSPGRGAHLVSPAAVYPGRRRSMRKAASNLDDYRPRVFGSDLDLFAAMQSRRTSRQLPYVGKGSSSRGERAEHNGLIQF